MRFLLHFTAHLETTDVSRCWPGACVSRKLNALPRPPTIAITTSTAAAGTSARAATPDISGLVHAEHSAFFVFSHLAFSPLFAPAVAGAAITHVKHAPLTFLLRKSLPPTTLGPTEH